MDSETKLLFAIVGGILVVASILGAILAKTAKSDGAKKTIANMNARTRSWWVMVGVFSATLLMAA